MKTLALSGAFVFSLALTAPAAVQESLQPIEAEQARNIAMRLVAEADKFEKPAIKIDADPEKANGVHVPRKLGIMVVPQKDLKESEELAAKFKSDKGAVLAYLFMYHIVPILDGKLTDSSSFSARFTQATHPRPAGTGQPSDVTAVLPCTRCHRLDQRHAPARFTKLTRKAFWSARTSPHSKKAVRST